MTTTTMTTTTSLCCIRTVTVFVTFPESVFENDHMLRDAVRDCAELGRAVEQRLRDNHYQVQTVRMATNPFQEWLYVHDGTCDDDDDDDDTTLRRQLPTIAARLAQLDQLLAQYQLDFCALGPSNSPLATRHVCPLIVQSSLRFSCSANVSFGDTLTTTSTSSKTTSSTTTTSLRQARAAADCIRTISSLDSPSFLQGGLGNFRFCASATCCVPYIPFFPVAKSQSNHRHHHHDNNKKKSNETMASTTANSSMVVVVVVKGFAVGLENGALAQQCLAQCASVAHVGTTFRDGMRDVLWPVQTVCRTVADERQTVFWGIDTSLNPSLDDKHNHSGSVANAMEVLLSGRSFGQSGTLAVAAAITTTLQSLPGIQHCGYSGLMLPVCEDRRLAELASTKDRTGGGNFLTIAQLLSVSSVCGVGVDTVPIPGDCTVEALTALILDVAALAGRWNKSLSCRVFPVPEKKAGDMTDFDSPYLCNCRVFPLT